MVCKGARDESRDGDDMWPRLRVVQTVQKMRTDPKGVVNVPVVVQRQAPMVQTAYETVMVPRLQLDRKS